VGARGDPGFPEVTKRDLELINAKLEVHNGQMHSLVEQVIEIQQLDVIKVGMRELERKSKVDPVPPPLKWINDLKKENEKPMQSLTAGGGPITLTNTVVVGNLKEAHKALVDAGLEAKIVPVPGGGGERVEVRMRDGTLKFVTLEPPTIVYDTPLVGFVSASDKQGDISYVLKE
jgi:hypothetical protein